MKIIKLIYLVIFTLLIGNIALAEGRGHRGRDSEHRRWEHRRDSKLQELMDKVGNTLTSDQLTAISTFLTTKASELSSATSPSRRAKWDQRRLKRAQDLVTKLQAGTADDKEGRRVRWLVRLIYRLNNKDIDQTTQALGLSSSTPSS